MSTRADPMARSVVVTRGKAETHAFTRALLDAAEKACGPTAVILRPTTSGSARRSPSGVQPRLPGCRAMRPGRRGSPENFGVWAVSTVSVGRRQGRPMMWIGSPKQPRYLASAVLFCSVGSGAARFPGSRPSWPGSRQGACSGQE
jgi:hypothetical protein